MAGILKVDRVQSDSNLAINIAGSNVAFFAANTLLMGGNTVISGNKIASTGMPVGSVLQTVQIQKTDTWTSSSTTWVNITGLTATITPSSTSSKILVMASVSVGLNGTYFEHIRMARNGSAILVGDAAGSRLQVQATIYKYNQLTPPSGNSMETWSHQYLDSPATTSALTYSIQMQQNDGGIMYVNRISRDDNASYEPRSASSLILMEIAG